MPHHLPSDTTPSSVQPPRRVSARARRRTIVAVASGLLILIGLMAAVLVVQFGQSRGQQAIETDHYQAVYTAGGQIYFGKLQNTAGDYLTLTHVYTAKAKSADAAANDATKAETSLVRGTQQVYGPEDSMAIAKSQVIFWQNLRSDSKVAQAIGSGQ